MIIDACLNAHGDAVGKLGEYGVYAEAARLELLGALDAQRNTADGLYSLGVSARDDAAPYQQRKQYRNKL